MEDWINEARREIVASSMRVIDQDAQVDNASLYMQTMAPLVAATPPGQKMNAAMIVEFLKVNRYSAEAQAAATEYEAAMTAISNMQTQMMLNPPPPNPQTPPGTPPGQATPPNATPEPDQGAAAASRGLAQ
jgi:hypothetical protein